MANRVGQHCAQLGQTGQAITNTLEHRVFPKWLKLLLAATGSLEENVKPLW